jgi:hypothetical protein
LVATTIFHGVQHRESGNIGDALDASASVRSLTRVESIGQNILIIEDAMDG